MTDTAVPSISVVMAVYNNAAFVGEAVESILAQTESDFEFLVMDDGSTDESGTILDCYAAADPRLRVWHRENRGLVASLNELAAHARAPLIARMDGDDRSAPNRFERQLAFRAANPDYGVIGTWCADIESDGASSWRDLPGQPTSHAEFVAAIAQRRPLLAHPAVLMERRLLEEVGGYRAAFRHCEDFDLWLRLVDLTHICSIPEQLYFHRYYEGQVSQRHLVEQLTGAAIAWLAWRERQAGRPDPMDGRVALPPLAELDALFGPDARAFVYAWVAPEILYSKPALTGAGFAHLIAHLKTTGTHTGLWKTVPRLVKYGAPLRAARLALALMGLR